MSFSENIKKEISLITNTKNKDFVFAEVFGYTLGNNYVENKESSRFCTESESSNYRLCFLLNTLNIENEQYYIGNKMYLRWDAKYKDNINDIQIENEDVKKCIVRGAFMSSGSINEPNKNYHLEIILSNIENVKLLIFILEQFYINCKYIKRKNNYRLYIKDGEEISKFLALIGAKIAVLNYEDIRILREVRSNINREVNYETANLNKTINTALKQINDIKLLKREKKYAILDDNLKEIATLRIKYPEKSLEELGKLLKKPIGKSGVYHRLEKITKLANELREDKIK